MDKTITVQAPGHINIIGEHTDYNDGFVLPGAIDKYITVSIHRNGTAHTANILESQGQSRHSFNLQNFAPLEEGWPNYVMGVVQELQKLGADIAGFDAAFEGNVPIGAGLSSSAALECSFATALNALFDLGFDKWQLIKASQAAENNFVGMQCGIMDQFASVMGEKDRVLLLDCRSLDYQTFPLELGDYQLLLLNSNVKHTLVSSGYNTRREECEEGVKLLKNLYPEITNLRDVEAQQLQTSQNKLPEQIYRRCRHVITENARVLQATKALQNGHLQELGELIFQSHHSLQYDYEVSCPEIDFLADLAKGTDYVLGSRMMGGGFGGCTINILEKKQTATFIEYASEQYQKQFGITLTPYEVSIEDGAKVIAS